MRQRSPGQRIGRVFMVLAWCAALFLATRFFGQWEARQQNPNVVVSSEQGEGFIEVKLVSNAQGHFVASGQINGHPVDFMLDTGATDVSIPADLAKRLKLEEGFGVTLSTANGLSQGYRTRIERLQLGDIVLRDVRALVAPGLHGDQIGRAHV